MHGGRVEARSDGLGTGSQFEVSLPILDDPVKDKPLEDTPAGRGSSRVLIVEDNADAAESMHMLLELLGHKVHAAADGFVALDILAENSFDVILIDIGLPAMDGYTLAGHIRALTRVWQRCASWRSPATGRMKIAAAHWRRDSIITSSNRSISIACRRCSLRSRLPRPKPSSV